MFKILVVDDEIQVLKALRRVLGRTFEVHLAIDGHSALEMLAQCQPDLVLSDYRMPLMNGAELVREIRRRSPRTPCILLSGYAGPDEPRESVTGGCTVLGKPWDDRLLFASLHSALASRAETA
jgi:CheY-like chemotaxis protein